MATAVLRAGLVVAALALGLFVLSKAFTSGEEATAPVSPAGGETTPESPTPSPPAGTDTGGGGGGGGTTAEPRDPSRVQVQVLNGTDVAGLADETRVMLEEAGYRVLTAANAQGGPYPTTIVSFLRKFRADAEVLQQQHFPGAELERAAPNAQVDITIILGEDYAAQQGGDEETG